MTKELVIRPIEQSDNAVWRALWTAYLEFYETSVSEDVYQVSFDRLLSKEPGEFSGLLAEIDDTPVGLVHFLYHRSMWSVENTCYLMDLFTAPGARGKGVARALIEEVHKTAKQDGVTVTYWATQEYNYNARMLYDQVAVRTPFILYEKED